MKKNLLVMAMAIIGMTGISAFAQTPENAAAPQAQDKMYRPQKMTDFLFEGILLDINQQTRIDSLNATMAKGPQGMRHKHMQRPQMGQAQDQDCCKMNPDSIKGQPVQAMGHNRKHQRPNHDAKGPRGAEARKAPGAPMGGALKPGCEYVAKVKEILTPEQFEVFMTNASNLPQHQQAKVAQCKKADCKKADCKKADCKKADCKKADCKKADCKKADCKKADCKNADCKKADCKKADGKPSKKDIKSKKSMKPAKAEKK